MRSLSLVSVLGLLSLLLLQQLIIAPVAAKRKFDGDFEFAEEVSLSLSLWSLYTYLSRKRSSSSSFPWLIALSPTAYIRTPQWRAIFSLSAPQPPPPPRANSAYIYNALFSPRKIHARRIICAYKYVGSWGFCLCGYFSTSVLYTGKMRGDSGFAAF